MKNVDKLDYVLNPQAVHRLSSQPRRNIRPIYNKVITLPSGLSKLPAGLTMVIGRFLH